MELSELQATMRTTYLERDAARGRDATFRWLTERYAVGCPRCGASPCGCPIA
jgi:hypothetical protein